MRRARALVLARARMERGRGGGRSWTRMAQVEKLRMAVIDGRSRGRGRVVWTAELLADICSGAQTSFPSHFAAGE